MELSPEARKEVSKSMGEEKLLELLPRSKERYLRTYDDFAKWQSEKGLDSISENVLLTYFGELSKKRKPSTLWSVYSMLKTTILTKHNINVKNYTELVSFIKRQSVGFKSQTSKALTAEEVATFINEAPDETYLATKVALIFGIRGGCRSTDLINITIGDVEKHGDVFVVKLPNKSSRMDRSFVVSDDESAKLVTKYLDQRPDQVETNRFFLRYTNGRCLKQVIGKNKLATFPKEIAAWLKLPDPECYTAHTLRRTSATLLNQIKYRHRPSTVAEWHIEYTDEDKNDTELNSEDDVSDDENEYPAPRRQDTLPERGAKAGQPSEATDESSHEGLKCNECQGSFRSFRYTCLQCNYDICDACEARGAHPLHYVLRVPGTKPRSEAVDVAQKIRAMLKEQDLEESQQVVPMETATIKVEIKHEPVDPLDMDIKEEPSWSHPYPDNEMEMTMLPLQPVAVTASPSGHSPGPVKTPSHKRPANEKADASGTNIPPITVEIIKEESTTDNQTELSMMPAPPSLARSRKRAAEDEANSGDSNTQALPAQVLNKISRECTPGSSNEQLDDNTASEETLTESATAAGNTVKKKPKKGHKRKSNVPQKF